MTAIVQINFDYDSSQQELLAGASKVAPAFAGIEGLLWKIWLVNDAEKGTGGIYLFESREQAEAYLNSDMVAMLRRERVNFSIKLFDILEAPSLLTKAAVTGAVA